MKFAEHLQAHITPEWRKQYINYEVRNSGNRGTSGAPASGPPVYAFVTHGVVTLVRAPGHERNAVQNRGRSAVGRVHGSREFTPPVYSVRRTLFTILRKGIGQNQCVLLRSVSYNILILCATPPLPRFVIITSVCSRKTRRSHA